MGRSNIHRFEVSYIAYNFLLIIVAKKKEVEGRWEGKRGQGQESKVLHPYLIITYLFLCQSHSYSALNFEAKTHCTHMENFSTFIKKK